MPGKLYDIIGVGIGPYNLGLAALLDNTPEIEGLFFDKTPKFEWHPGMLIERMNLTTPFLGDLVTFADPTSRFTYINYLHEHNRLYQFYFYNKFQIPRQEYNHYLQWVANQLEQLHFGYEVIDVIDHENTAEPHYEVVVKDTASEKQLSYFAKNIAMATGSEPFVLDSMTGHHNEDVLHTNRYMYEKENLVESPHITVIGSGQSAIEVFLYLLKEQENNVFQLTLFTRSSGLFQLEKAKFGQEYFSPDFVSYFHSLGFKQRLDTLDTLGTLRKGINPQTLMELYETLYHKTIGQKPQPVIIQPNTEVKNISRQNDTYILRCHQWQKENSFDYETNKVILATGYKPHIPAWFYDRFKDKIVWEDEDHYKVTRDYQLVFHDQRDHRFFTMTNLEHSHGTAATNLGLAIQKNIKIVNLLAGRDVYPDRHDTIFQQFTMDNNR
ncbi:lysine N(6)-hydroxylase/L-ornithine N(5)-oxygenase family protein [Lentibacillus amyloliquefaciens]|uniref:L-lysine N6-monooxygenase MbtG n=1 Tax=Lentibacillus amyloliquefaciens TaxID=1472767 RepID=A0A0U4EC89_9BACI|nr:SidA/IucD/PvdA family monooxygenase [Lentibacillus amyloliquefaciens]ALX50657.1 ornithine monooxygenase [Lentibacillus amyloliquefaciens]